MLALKITPENQEWQQKAEFPHPNQKQPTNMIYRLNESIIEVRKYYQGPTSATTTPLLQHSHH
ncbi:hypothetical protein Sjap_010432 [Stephania japonica]|uniref:Uncharacterized protein n=1 Tax=Stephania japonica TaxID=461633 RepID=A0AAP0JB70_9MAGN